MDAVVIIDENGIVVEWNPAAEKLFGYAGEQAKGNLMADLIVPERLRKAHYRGLAKYMHTGDPGPILNNRVEVTALCENGKEILVELMVNPFEWQGKPHFISYMRDISVKKQQEENIKTLINELNHRVKNTLAIVQSIAQQTLRGENIREIKQLFEGRLLAISAAHNLLTEDNWEGAELREIVEQAIQGFKTDQRIHLEGDATRLPPDVALNISMVVQELATNSLKYGSLSATAGIVNIHWKVRRNVLTLTWQELCGPPVAKPSRKGFGTRLLDRAFSQYPGGKVSVDYARKGIVCNIVTPLSNV